MRISAVTVAVLRAFLESPTDDMYGFDLMTRCKIRPGTLYPILARLENCGWLESNWNDMETDNGPQLRRRAYRLSHVGQMSAIEAVADRRIDMLLRRWIRLGHEPGLGHEPVRGPA